MPNILSLFNKYKTVSQVLSSLNDGKRDLLVYNSTPHHHALLAGQLFKHQDRPLLYVAANIYKATIAYETLCQLVGFENVHFYATDEVVAADLLAASSEFRFERIHTINSILEHKKSIIITHIGALTRPLMPKEIISSHVVRLQKGATINPQKLIRELVEAGYRKVGVTQAVGEFSVRGEVIDIYPINLEQPLRIDLFDIEIDFIKYFDPMSQKTTNEIFDAIIYPLNELIYHDPEAICNQIIQDAKGDVSALGKDLEDIKNFHNLERLHPYISYMTSKPSSLLDYLDDPIIILEEVKHIEENHEKTMVELANFLEEKRSPVQNHLLYYFDAKTLIHSPVVHLYLSEFRQGYPGYQFDALFDLHGFLTIDYGNDIQSLATDLKAIVRPIILTASTVQTLGLIEEILKDRNLNYQKIDVIPPSFQNAIYLMIAENGISFAFTDGIEVIHESSIFKKLRPRKAKYRSAYQEANMLHDVDDLKPGDYVVHYDYGISQYLGIKTVELQDIKSDYIMLRFANMELYIPVENINLLERYQGSEGSVPRLTSIGTKDWENKKAKISQKLESIAHDLIRIQALREEEKGHQYGPDDSLQQDFEQDFEFIETPDQLKAIEAIKRDMEHGLIIDRLVCGDVGYGKTEVAMRIALKTVMAGQQVAYLAPTTILTRQHYLNFKDRFSRYGVKVALFNRMVDSSEQVEVLKGLKNGRVDIVIGTHKLLSDDVKFKHLGLLIVDEEQRFGVVHKEKIKQLKTNVNVVTLTATPIPRTLQMALMGVRQLSLIETPPQNRYPVQTYVLEKNDNIVREAIYRELGRGGQVFFLHNRISDLERVYRHLQKLVPEAKILIAHGQMERTALEDAIAAFIDREFDVLLCTTIIETGIDIPNTNTLIVDMADRLGLAQMYQIRGRVGRSDRVSYAYFMFEESKVLTDSGLKRLNAIKEFTTLGSGYKIAVRDLAIRGAGDILGREQSGFIDSIGLDMYMKLLSDAMMKAQGIKQEDTIKPAIDIEVSKHVAEHYVSDDEVKIFIHKEIAKITNKAEKDALEATLVDRFGTLTHDLIVYMNKKYLDGLFALAGVEDAKDQGLEVRVTFSQETSSRLQGAKLFQAANKINPIFKFEYRGRKIHIILPKRPKSDNWMDSMMTLFETITNQTHEFYHGDL